MTCPESRGRRPAWRSSCGTWKSARSASGGSSPRSAVSSWSTASSIPAAATIIQLSNLQMLECNDLHPLCECVLDLKYNLNRNRM